MPVDPDPAPARAATVAASASETAMNVRLTTALRSATVDQQLLAVRQHDLLETDDLLAVTELGAEAGDLVARLERGLRPSSASHLSEGRTAHTPLLHGPVVPRQVEREHRMRVHP